MRIIRVDQDKMLDKEWDGMVLDIWLLAIAGAAYRWSVEKKEGDTLRRNVRIDASLRVWLTAKTQRQVHWLHLSFKWRLFWFILCKYPNLTYHSSDV